jgi:type II secretory pathway component PulK
MKFDPTGKLLHDALVKLPNMSEELANNIIAWMGGSVGITNGGAGDEYYMNLKPAYRCKNGPPDSLDELLLVKGVTRDLLYGADINRNGYQDDVESTTAASSTATTNGFDRGWSAFLTVHSREQNCDPKGNPYINLNDQDVQQLYNALSVEVGDDVAKFVVLCRQKGATYASAAGATSSQDAASGNTNATIGNLSDYQIDFTKTTGNFQILSFFRLVSSQVSVKTTVKDPQTGKDKTIYVLYNSPFTDPAAQRDLLPKLIAVSTVNSVAELPARVNVNTAPPEVLAAVGFSDTDVQKILQVRQGGESLGEIYQTPTWLLTEAQVPIATLYKICESQTLEDKTSCSLITTRSQVYRVQSVGYYDYGKGPTVRVEAVIDTNCGRPRIIAYRNLSELGKGWSDPNLGQGQNQNQTTTP